MSQSTEEIQDIEDERNSAEMSQSTEEIQDIEDEHNSAEMSQSTEEIQDIEDEPNSAEINQSTVEIQGIQDQIIGSTNWMRKMEEKLQQLDPLSDKLSIFRVPYNLRNVKNEAYSPSIVSIGPFHHRNETVAAMEKQKWHYMQYFFKRVEGDERSLPGLEKCNNAIHGLDAMIRRMYAEKISCKAHDLAQMMLLDGCFILELLLRYGQQLDGNLSDTSDPIFNNVWMIPALRHDLLLLENQIPFCVLEHLYNALNLRSGTEPPRSVAALALKFFNRLSQKQITNQEPSRECNHLLDLLYKFYFLPAANNHSLPTTQTTASSSIPPTRRRRSPLPTTQPTQSSSIPLTGRRRSPLPTTQPSQSSPIPLRRRRRRNDMYAIKDIKAWGIKYSASNLLTGGIRFIKESTQGQLLNITFSNEEIKIPPVLIDETTDSLFRNLIALEQCSLRSRHHVTSYVILMSSFIRSSTDILTLWKKEIIIKHKGDGGQKLVWENGIIIKNDGIEGYEFWTDLIGMLDQVVVKEFYFEDLCDKVNAVTDGWFLLPIFLNGRRILRQVNVIDIFFNFLSYYISLLVSSITAKPSGPS